MGIVKPLRVSRWRRPTTGKSTVRQRAEYPAAWTRWSMSSDAARSVNRYSCHHFANDDAAATSSRKSTVVEETTMMVPARSAARAVAGSPSGCAIR